MQRQGAGSKLRGGAWVAMQHGTVRPGLLAGTQVTGLTKAPAAHRPTPPRWKTSAGAVCDKANGQQANGQITVRYARSMRVCVRAYVQGRKSGDTGGPRTGGKDDRRAAAASMQVAAEVVPIKGARRPHPLWPTAGHGAIPAGGCGPTHWTRRRDCPGHAKAAASHLGRGGPEPCATALGRAIP